MNPHAQLSASLVVAMLLWSPSLMATMAGDLDLLASALRFAVALTVARAAIGGLSHLYASYRIAQLDGDASGGAAGAPQPAVAD